MGNRDETGMGTGSKTHQTAVQKVIAAQRHASCVKLVTSFFKIKNKKTESKGANQIVDFFMGSCLDESRLLGFVVCFVRLRSNFVLNFV